MRYTTEGMTAMTLDEWARCYRHWYEVNCELEQFHVELERERKRFRGATLASYVGMLAQVPERTQAEAFAWEAVRQATDAYVGARATSRMFLSGQPIRRIETEQRIVQENGRHRWELWAAVGGDAVCIATSDRSWESFSGARSAAHRIALRRNY